jgi:hypothetical protein
MQKFHSFNPILRPVRTAGSPPPGCGLGNAAVSVLIEEYGNMVKSEDGKTEGSTPPSRGRLRSVGGSLNDTFNVFLACQALNTLLLESDDPHLRDEFVSITLPRRRGTT